MPHRFNNWLCLLLQKLVCVIETFFSSSFKLDDLFLLQEEDAEDLNDPQISQVEADWNSPPRTFLGVWHAVIICWQWRICFWAS